MPVSHITSVAVLTATLLAALTPGALTSPATFMCHGSLSAGSFSSARLCASDSPSPRYEEKRGNRMRLVYFFVAVVRVTDPH